MAGASEKKPSKEVPQDREVSRRGKIKEVFGQLTSRSPKVSDASNSDGSSDTKEKKSDEEKSEASIDTALQDSGNLSARSTASDGINGMKHRLLLDMEVPPSSRQRAEALLKTLGRLGLGIFKFAVDSKAEPPRIGNEEGLQLAKDRDVYKAQVADQAGYVQGLVDQAIQKHREISDKQHQEFMQDLETHKQVFDVENQRLKENLEKQKKEQQEIEHHLEQQKKSYAQENQKLRQDLEKYRQALDTHRESSQEERDYLFERYEEVLSSQEQLQSNVLVLQKDSDRLNEAEARKFAVFRRDNHQPPGPEDGSAIAAGNAVAHYGNPIGDVSRLERDRERVQQDDGLLAQKRTHPNKRIDRRITQGQLDADMRTFRDLYGFSVDEIKQHSKQSTTLAQFSFY